MASFVYLVRQHCCDGQLVPGDLLVHTPTGFHRLRRLDLRFDEVLGADLDGKLECVYPSDTPQLGARAALQLVKMLAGLPSPFSPDPEAPEALPSPPRTRGHLRRLK